VEGQLNGEKILTQDIQIFPAVDILKATVQETARYTADVD